MADKKPDLSDLKARLGLTKPAPSAPPPSAAGPAGGPPAAAPPANAGASSGPPAAARPPAASGPPASAPPPAAAPPAAGPPPAAAPPSSGPPKAAARPKPRPAAAPATSGPSYSGNNASASIDLGAIGDAGLERGKSFSGPVIAALIIAAVVGAGFTWAIMSGVNARQLIEIRQNDAMKLRDAVKPKIVQFEETNEKLQKLEPLIPDLELAKDLADDDFVVPGAILSSVSIPLEGLATDRVASYAADSVALKTMLSEHVRYTEADAEELQKIAADNKAVQENAGFGVIVDPKKIADGFDKDGFVHERGRLVGFRKFLEKEKKVEIAVLPAGDVRQVEVNEFVPIEAAEILKAGGQNALQRHKRRVQNIKFQANRIAEYKENLLDSLNSAAGTGGSDAPAEAKPEPESGDEAAESEE